ncbi:glycosyltransferase family 4 protein [Nocardioides sambongensis]|uniref:glycosyltransferase family 4 protein n=1 Tax=Nocardioides sambongensis TaxID=2589074 RepID=UPI00112DCF19|nr:glycosyltransferase family 4 protein [Nocardioides sambongensis]
MRILVYPHSMEIGGSQTNAVELAAAVRDRGHEVIVYSDDGPMVERVSHLGLEHLARRRSRFRPGVGTALDLRRIASARGIDIVHGYEWPTIFEAEAATTGTRTEALGTIMSMAVAPFLPSSVPLVVGTAAIQAVAESTRRGPVHLIEPPVDTGSNRPTVSVEVPAIPGLSAEAIRVVIVSRLVPELKLEGILTAIAACDRLGEDHALQLVIVGDGPARKEVEEHAAAVNNRLGRVVVVVAGEWPDPRWAYASADVCLGMGGSALRAAAFAKPLVVQGERGFFELLEPNTVDQFFEQGWYGVSDLTPSDAVRRLVELLGRLLKDGGERMRIGKYARQVIEDRFSLDSAARRQEELYNLAIERPRGTLSQFAGLAHASGGLIAYKVRCRRAIAAGASTADDFNARPVLGVSSV